MNKKKYHKNISLCDDLEIDKKISDALDNTITSFGAKKLKNKLKHYASDINELQKNTRRLRSICQNHTYRAQMRNDLLEIKKLESDIIDWMSTDCNKDLLFSYNFLNNRIFLTVTNKMKLSSILVLLCFYVIIFGYMRYNDVPVTPYGYCKQIINSYYYFIKFLTCFIFTNRDWIETITIALLVGYLGYQTYSMYQTVNTCYEHYNKCSDFYTSYSKIEDMLDISQRMSDNDVYFEDAKITDAIKDLKITFDNESSLGYGLVCKLDIASYMDNMNTVVNFIGRIDYSLCIAGLLDGPYTIPTFIDSQFPVLTVSGAWNPLIDKNKRIKNSLNMDVMTPNVAIISGPNKAGKSTFMRTIILNVYLSQSLGIACADQCIISPFKNIFTYLNVPDTVGRESLFEAEINRCFDYIEKLESFNGLSIGIVDELFTGTNPEEGMAGSYGVLKRIKLNPTSLTLLSTHFHQLLDDIKDDTDKVTGINEYSFYKFVAHESRDGKFGFDYKISPGTSSQKIALKLLKEKGFNKNIISDSMDYMNNLKNKTSKSKSDPVI